MLRSSLVALVLLAGLLIGCSGGSQPGQLRLSGTVESVGVDVAARVNGQVEFLVEEGTRVRLEDPLVRLDRRELSELVAQAEATRQAAQEGVRQADLTVRYRSAQARAAQQQAGAAVDSSQVRVGESLARYRQDDAQTLALGQQSGAGVDAAGQAVGQARARMQQARERADLAGRERKRQEELFASGFVSAQVLDRARTEARAAEKDYEQARAGWQGAAAQLDQARGRHSESQALRLGLEVRAGQVQEARAGVSEAEAQLVSARAQDLGVEVASQEARAARARLKEATAALELARTRLGYAEIRSPVDGIVSEKMVEAGEQITPGQPLLRVNHLEEVWVDVYLPEDRLEAVWLGMEAAIEVDTRGAPRKLSGTVTFISPQAEFTPRNVQTQEERVNLTYRVRVRADNPEEVLKPGMPVDVVLDLTRPRPERGDGASHGAGSAASKRSESAPSDSPR